MPLPQPRPSFQGLIEGLKAGQVISGLAGSFTASFRRPLPSLTVPATAAIRQKRDFFGPVNPNAGSVRNEKTARIINSLLLAYIYSPHFRRSYIFFCWLPPFPCQKMHSGGGFRRWPTRKDPTSPLCVRVTRALSPGSLHSRIKQAWNPNFMEKKIQFSHDHICQMVWKIHKRLLDVTPQS